MVQVNIPIEELKDNIHVPKEGYDFFENYSKAPLRPSEEFSMANAWVLSEFSRLAHVYDTDRITKECNSIGFEVEFFYRENTEAHVAWNNTTIVIFFRGTQLNDIRDIFTDLNLFRKKSDYHGYVHRGFKCALDYVWKDLKNFVDSIKEGREIVITGHSLGGALATICAARMRCKVLYTFGSPRVGNIMFSKNLDKDVHHYRFVNIEDIVPGLPPALFGYMHSGVLKMISQEGKFFDRPSLIRQHIEMFKSISFWDLISIKWWLNNVFKHFMLITFADHDVINYNFWLKEQVFEKE